MTPLEQLRARGLTVRLEGEVLKVGPPQLVTEDVRGLVTANRPAIVAALRAEWGRAWLALHLRAAEQLPGNLSPAEYARVDALVDALDGGAVEREVVRLRQPQDQEEAVPIARSEAEALRREMAQRKDERSRFLRLLLAAGPEGVPNAVLDPEHGTGRRYGGRLLELRQEGWLVETAKEGQREYRYTLRGYLPGSKAEKQLRGEEKHAA